MKTLIKLAWRNIWRNTRRTIILICAMSVGLFGILATRGLVNGWLDQMVQNAVNSYTGHIAVFANGYFENQVVEKNFAVDKTVAAAVDSIPQLENWTERIKVSGLISNAEHSTMIGIVGVDPIKEAKISIVASSIVEGRWLTPDDKYGIVLGARTVERFRTKLGHKVVLMSQQLGDEIGSGAYRIVGIFKTEQQGFDESVAYINLPDAQTLVNLAGKVTDITVLLKRGADVNLAAAALRSKLGTKDLEVLTWKQQQPMVVKMVDLSRQMMVLFYAIFFIAMAFGIVNTLLMAVNERFREIGIMLAIGTRRWQIIAMIGLESFFIAIVSVIVGGAIGTLTVKYFQHNGMNLAAFAEGLDYFGLGHVLYPSLNAMDVFVMSLWTFIIAVLFSLYPAIRACRFRPVDAIHMN